MMSIPKQKLETAMLRQMDIQNAMYPDRVPVLEVPGGLEPLEFARMVNDNFPVLLKKSVDMPALKWTASSLREKIGGLECQVAQTPLGNADSPHHGVLFVKPHIEPMTVNKLLDQLETQSWPVCYMQSQDDNLSKEFEPLTNDVEDIIWATQVIGHEPEAVNLWIGDSRTTSRLHNDNYENLFLQISGKKDIYLIPPGNAYALDERFLVEATYVKTGNDNEFQISIDDSEQILPGDITAQQLGNTQLQGSKMVFPTVNPQDPATFNRVYKQHAKVYKVTVNPGDVLYIPASWYHQVCITEGPSISLNYWYPVSSMRPLWSSWDYNRMTSMLIRGYHDPYFFDESDDDL